jgi:hypothetical protein
MPCETRPHVRTATDAGRQAPEDCRSSDGLFRTVSESASRFSTDRLDCAAALQNDISIWIFQGCSRHALPDIFPLVRPIYLLLVVPHQVFPFLPAVALTTASPVPDICTPFVFLSFRHYSHVDS